VSDQAPPIESLVALRNRLRTFCAERNWHRYHSPKNLVMALSVETAELVEHFQWMTADESSKISDEKRKEVADEVADVLIYLTELADVLNIDMLDATQRKIEKNAKKYPVPLNGKLHDSL
jgi:dCTP diphosphatase